MRVRFLVLFAMCSLLVIPRSGAVEEESWKKLATYFASLITHADALGHFSPHAAEDIRALATDLAGKAHAARTEEEKQKVIGQFGEIYREIFPEKSAHPLGPFQTRAGILLADVPDVLPLLVEGAVNSSSALAALQSDVTLLQAELSTLSHPETSLLFFDHFEEFAGTLFTFAPGAPLPLLREDLRRLLTNLQDYLTSMETMEVRTGMRQDDIDALEETLATLKTEADLDTFLEDLEKTLTHLPPSA